MYLANQKKDDKKKKDDEEDDKEETHTDALARALRARIRRFRA